MKFFDFKGLVGKAWAGGTHVITGNLNQPIKLNMTNIEDKICDNHLTNGISEDTENEQIPVDNSKQITNKILSKPDLKFVSNPVTWQQMSPKKEKKSSSSSGSSDCSSSGESQHSGLKTWATIKKTSVENMELKSNSNSGHSSSTSSSSSGGSPTRTWSSIRQENKNNTLNRKDGSPTKRGVSLDSQKNEVILKNLQNSPDHKITKTEEKIGLDNSSFSSNNSPVHSDKKFLRKTDSGDCDNSSTSLPLGGTSQEEGWNNDYFYDEDFTVQFDSNLRESTPNLNLNGGEQSSEMEFPNMVTGSYLSFKNVKSSGVVVHEGTELFCPEESQISCSRHSNMDVSTSEREMMCSSDMLDFSDNPLFTPPLSGDVHMVSQEDSTDSLDKVNKDKGRMELSAGSHTSSDGNLNLDCFPRKEEYFLSFDGSQGHTESYTDQSNSLNSNCSSQGQNVYNPNHVNVCSNEDLGEESSESFHICMSGNTFLKKPQVGNRLAKFQTLSALQEQTNELSASSEYSDEKPCSEPVTSPTKRTFRKLSPTKGKQLRFAQKMCFACHLNNSTPEDNSSPSRSRSRQKSVTSWKQVKSLKKLGKLDNILDASRSRSMPDICLRTWQSGSSLSCHGHDIQKIAESFHCKRHSAYLLDLYQRVRNQSNPVSPECMANIEQILFHNVICRDLKLGNSSHHCEFCHGDSNSSNTMVNSQQVTKDGKRGYYNHKRILDWLERDKLENKIHRSCQTESLMKTKDTDVSPTTVTLWCGTKNFASQFPPSAKDCAIQTAVHELMDNTQDCEQQTTPTLEGKPMIPKTIIKDKILTSSKSDKKSTPYHSLDKSDILKLISHDFKEIDNLLPQTNNVNTKTGAIPRSKSADSANKKHKPQAGLENKSLYYSHKSLPDLSFIELKHHEEKLDDGSSISLFDPLPIAMPVPVFIPTVVDSNKVTKSLSTKTSIDNLVHCCRGNSKCRAKGHRSHSAPARSHNSNLVRQTESPSSSSGFTSSTSSGIDPGYSDKCFHNGSPTNDIERLIFYPPHVENTQKGDYISENLSDSGNISLPSQSEKPKKQCKSSKTGDKKVKQYVNEIHPGSLDKKTKTKVVRSPNSNSNVSHSSSGSSLHLEHLYALQEEHTPVSSPERELCHHESEYFSGNAYCVHCFKGQDGGHVEGWENEEVVIRRRKFDYHIQLSSESGSSGSGSFFPNFDKKPLKSCLRKRQFLRTRSLSDPHELVQQGDPNKVKRNRHSYAYEEVVLLQDENGEYFLCKNDDNEDEPVVLYVEEKANEDENTTVVKLRPKTNEKESSVDFSEKELNGKRKSVSFASEVSFHAISPHMSPKRQHGSGENDEGASVEKGEKSSSEKQEVMSSEVQTDAKTETEPKIDDEVQSASDEAPPTEFKVSPTGEINPDSIKGETNVECGKDQKKALLSEISSAAESLVEHFASAKNPFDKLRLGSSEDTPMIGDLVLSRLCPAVCCVINEGLKSHLAGVQVFGRVQITAWKLAEASVEQGPYTRAIHDLVQQIKGHTGLVAHSSKFDAFVFGLLNLRLLDYWLGYLRHNTTIVEKYYTSNSVMALCGTLYERQFSEVLISLQPLAVLPFQLSTDYITSGLNMQGSETTSTVKEESLKKDNNPADKCMTDSFSKEKAIIGVAASKAWDWLKNGAAPKSPNDETSSPPIFTGNVMISSITGMLGKISGSSKFDAKKESDVEKKTGNDDAKNTQDTDRPILAAGLVNDVQVETPPAKPPRMHLDLELPVSDSENGVSAVVDSKEVTPRRSSGDNSSKSLTYEENSMLSSFSGMAQKLLGIKAEKIDRNDTVNKKTESEEKNIEEKKEESNENKTLVVLRPKKPEISDVESEKNKSGLIRLFDKLLLPRDSSKKEQKLKSRWSWGYGQGQQIKNESGGNKNVPIKSDAKPSALPLQSKVPQYGRVSGVQSRSSIATVPSKLVTRQQPMKNSGLSLKNTESYSSKSSTASLQDKPKDQSTKTSKDRPAVKSKVPVRKVTNQKIPKEQPKSSDHKTDRVPKTPENKWQGAVTLSASLEEGPTLKAPPSVTQKMNKEETKTEGIPQSGDVSKSENQRKLNNDNIASRLTYQDAMTTDGSENPLHLSDEINCNSPVHNGTMTFNPNTTDKTADTGFRKPNFRFVKTIVSSDQSTGGDFSYVAGDQFEALAQLDSDWMYCINGKKEGLIRIEHLKPLTDEDFKTS